MLAVVGFHGRLQGFQGVVYSLVDGHIDFRRGRPQHYDTAALPLLAEAADVGTQHFHHLPASGDALAISNPLDIIAVQALGIVLVERGRHGDYLLQLLTNGGYILFVQHLGVHGGLIGILRIDVPGAENNIVQPRQRHDVCISEVFLVSAATHAHLVHLGHRADQFRQSFTSHQHSRHQGGGHGSAAYDKYSQLALGRFNSDLFHILVIKVSHKHSCRRRIYQYNGCSTTISNNG